jgi:hypothetical protein
MTFPTSNTTIEEKGSLPVLCTVIFASESGENNKKICQKMKPFKKKAFGKE